MTEPKEICELLAKLLADQKKQTIKKLSIEKEAESNDKRVS